MTPALTSRWSTMPTKSRSAATTSSRWRSIQRIRKSSILRTPQPIGPPTAEKTLVAIKGAPGGDDYHTVWINPRNPKIVALASDQGATISVDGGATWSSWYNQPTAQMYHVNADNRFPYWVCGGQQESGSACVISRGNWGKITERDWRHRRRARVRLRRARSAAPRHHLRRKARKTRRAHRPDPRSLAARAAVQTVPHGAYRTDRVRPFRPAPAVFRHERRLRDRRRRPKLARDQPRPDASESRRTSR